MYFYVYKTTNTVNGKIYVGKHKSEKHPLENGYLGSGKLLLAAIQKYGRRVFTKEVLVWCNSLDEMASEEAAIVTEEFVSRPDTYNMHRGGNGGFDHINNNATERARVTQVASQYNKVNGVGGTAHITPDGMKRVVDTARRNQPLATRLANTDDAIAKKKATWERTGRGKGSNNSQAGTMWITDGSTNRKIQKNAPMPDGWVAGRCKTA